MPTHLPPRLLAGSVRDSWHQPWDIETSLAQSVDESMPSRSPFRRSTSSIDRSAGQPSSVCPLMPHTARVGLIALGPGLLIWRRRSPA